MRRINSFRGDGSLVDEVVQYKDVHRLCYVRGPESILIGLAEQISSPTDGDSSSSSKWNDVED
ncbi:MAG: hypothetical protein ACJ75G_02565 [Gaiellaceae bacterium]